MSQICSWNLETETQVRCCFFTLCRKYEMVYLIQLQMLYTYESNNLGTSASISEDSIERFDSYGFIYYTKIDNDNSYHIQRIYVSIHNFF